MIKSFDANDELNGVSNVRYVTHLGVYLLFSS